MLPTGRARSEVAVVDLSTLVAIAATGIAGVIGITERGEIGVPKLVSSSVEFNRYFGNVLLDDDFSLLCIRALDAGAKLKVSRVAHYADITDKSSLSAAKASVTVGGVTLTAINEGEWANGVTVTFLYPKSGRADRLDISISGSAIPDANVYVKDMPLKPLIADVQRFNGLSTYYQMSVDTVGKTITQPTEAAPVTGTTAGGAYDLAKIVEADYIGNVDTSTGLHAFDEDSQIMRIAVPTIATATMDDAIAAYVGNRNDIRGYLHTPVGMTGLGAIDYRYRKGAFADTGVAVDNHLLSMTTGGLSITHPLTKAAYDITEVTDVLAIETKKDSKFGQWFAGAGYERGRIPNTLGVLYNLGSSARADIADDVDSAGINPVIDHETFGRVYWGNGTMSQEDTMLKFENVSDLVVYAVRVLKKSADKGLFNPNDITEWQTLYNRVRPFFQLLKDRRGVWDWSYQGDQTATSLDDITVNKREDVDRGKYVAIIGLKPKVAMKYIYIQLTVLNSSTSFDILTEDDLNNN